MWTSIDFIPTLDPVRGCQALLVNEMDISKAKNFQAELLEAQRSQVLLAPRCAIILTASYRSDVLLAPRSAISFTAWYRSVVY